MMRQAVWTRVFREVFLTQWELRVCPERGKLHFRKVLKSLSTEGPGIFIFCQFQS